MTMSYALRYPCQSKNLPYAVHYLGFEYLKYNGSQQERKHRHP